MSEISAEIEPLCLLVSYPALCGNMHVIKDIRRLWGVLRGLYLGREGGVYGADKGHLSQNSAVDCISNLRQERKVLHCRAIVILGKAKDIWLLKSPVG
jgi:hypothetical protein